MEEELMTGGEGKKWKRLRSLSHVPFGFAFFHCLLADFGNLVATPPRW